MARAGGLLLVKLHGSAPESSGRREVDLAAAYRRHAGFVWRVLRRLGVPVDQVDDAAHEVFVVACRRQHDLYDPEYERSWLFGIARRVAMESRRRDRRHRDLSPPGVVASATEASAPDQAIERAQMAELARELLAQLDGPRRDVFVLAELEAMTGPEISKALGIKLNTVYSRLRKARAQFERALHRYRAKQAESRRSEGG
jgi:RNA polymerase sigma-70 factor (ECF subfamily)